MSRPSSTSHITQPQLCKLSGLSPAFFTLHGDELPPHTVLHDGSKSRPPKAWTLEQIADLILSRTSLMTDIQCRLRCALLAKPTEGDLMPNPFPGFRHIAGSNLFVPIDSNGCDAISQAPEHEQPELQAALVYERQLDAEKHAAACARNRARKHSEPAN